MKSVEEHEERLTDVDQSPAGLDDARAWLGEQRVSADRAWQTVKTARRAEPFDPVRKPAHYNSHPSGIEAIELCRHMSFCLDNVIKYVLRAPYKGSELEDLKKARWYLDDEIARLEKESGK